MHLVLPEAEIQGYADSPPAVSCLYSVMRRLRAVALLDGLDDILQLAGIGDGGCGRRGCNEFPSLNQGI